MKTKNIIKCPEKCKNCEYRKNIDYIRPYNFCKKLNVSFSGDVDSALNFPPNSPFS